MPSFNDSEVLAPRGSVAAARRPQDRSLSGNLVEGPRAVAQLLCEASQGAGHTAWVQKCHPFPLPSRRRLGLLADATLPVSQARPV